MEKQMANNSDNSKMALEDEANIAESASEVYLVMVTLLCGMKKRYK